MLECGRMERLPLSLRLDSKTMEIMDRLCEQNEMERTTFMQFAILGVLDYAAELGVLPPIPGESVLEEPGEQGAGACEVSLGCVDGEVRHG